MGKKTRWREAHRHEAEQRVSAVLEAKSRLEARSRAPELFQDFKPEYRDQIAALRERALRAPEDWRCRIKSRLEERRFIDLVRFVFARYPVPAHLEQVWFTPVEDDYVDRDVSRPSPFQFHKRRVPDLRRWYTVATQGGSLFKADAHRFLTKQETHHFLKAPHSILSSKQAFWYAVARAAAESDDIALKISRSKIAAYSIASSYWKEIARFFAWNPVPVPALDDLADYLLAARQEDRNFTLKGRTLASLERKMKDWHRDLRREKAITGGAWAGSPLPDVDYAAGSEENPAIWRFRQIKTGNALFQEGTRMHHCVVAYKWACESGNVSIWSLTSEFPIGRVNRGVTMEITKDGRIVQCRGFGNRLPHGNEVTMVKRWAQDHALIWASPER
jgi:hypothetical protein